MATVPEAPIANAIDLQLPLQAPERRSRGSWAVIWLVSAACQSILLFWMLQLAAFTTPPNDVSGRTEWHRTPLYFPRTLTQREANRTTPARQINLAALLARRAASPSPSHNNLQQKVEKTAANQPPSPPPNRATQTGPIAAPQPTQIEPSPEATTKTAQAQAPPGLPAGVSTAPLPPPPQPKPTLSAPRASVQSAIQALSQNPATGHTTITDRGESLGRPGAPAANGHLGSQHMEVELKSDAEAPDFRAYLAQILSIIRGNWRRVTPESVRLGTLRGENSIDVIIDREGRIPKLVIGDSANVDALDRASVAGVSMSNPLPPLPADFKGEQVRLTFTFKYNMPE